MVQPAMQFLRDCMLGRGHLPFTVTVLRRDSAGVSGTASDATGSHRRAGLLVYLI